MNALFLRHEGFLGAVGAFLKVHPMTGAPPGRCAAAAELVGCPWGHGWACLQRAGGRVGVPACTTHGDPSRHSSGGVSNDAGARVRGRGCSHNLIVDL